MSLLDPDLAVHLGLPANATWACRVHGGVVHRRSSDRRRDDAGRRLLHAVFDARVDRPLAQGRFRQPRPRQPTKARAIERTEKDIPPRWVLIGILALLVPITGIYYYFTHGLGTAIVAALVMSVTGFLLSAVGGYLVGLVGSSNQPVSGLTLAALVIAALVMVALGVKGVAGVAAVLGVAAVVCCACCVSGSLIQDLKAGHLLGGTPWKMQLVEIIAVALLAFFLDLADHRAARGLRHRQPRSARAASRTDGATRERDRQRPNGLGTDRHRRGVRRGAHLLRRGLPDAGRRRNVPAL